MFKSIIFFLLSGISLVFYLDKGHTISDVTLSTWMLISAIFLLAGIFSWGK